MFPFRSSARLLVLKVVCILAFAIVSIVALGACGEQQVVESPEEVAAHAKGNFVAMILIQDLQEDGTNAPVANVEVTYNVLGVGAEGQKELYTFTGKTDANGYSVVFRNIQDRSSADIGVLFIDLKAADGRARTARKETRLAFDFGEWFAEFTPEPVNREAVLAQACASAADPAHCQTTLKSGDYKTWGAAVLVRLTPIRKRGGGG